MNNEHSTNSILKAFSPWFYIWIQPRHTIRQFINSNNPAKNMILISMIAGFFNVLNQASNRNWGDHISLVNIFLISMIGGAFTGILGLYLGSFILKITGRWIGGNGSAANIRVAITRGINTPTILIGLIWIPELIIFQTEMFSTLTPRIDRSTVLTLIFYILLAVESVLSIWSLIIGLKSIGEAHEFSALKAFWSILIPIGILVGAIILIVLLLSILR